MELIRRLRRLLRRRDEPECLYVRTYEAQVRLLWDGGTRYLLCMVTDPSTAMDLRDSQGLPAFVRVPPGRHHVLASRPANVVLGIYACNCVGLVESENPEYYTLGSGPDLTPLPKDPVDLSLCCGPENAQTKADTSALRRILGLRDRSE